MSNMPTPFKEIEDLDLLDEITSSKRATRGEYGVFALEFFNANKKAIEIETATDSDSPFAGRTVTTVYQGFRNAFKRANISEDKAKVITYTNGGGKPTVYLINVALCRPSSNNTASTTTDEE